MKHLKKTLFVFHEQLEESAEGIFTRHCCLAFERVETAELPELSVAPMALTTSDTRMSSRNESPSISTARAARGQKADCRSSSYGGKNFRTGTLPERPSIKSSAGAEQRKKP
jgi:hypothetical protein